MGFRSVLITEDNALKIPEWFIIKYAKVLHFSDGGLPISSQYEFKTYFEMWPELLTDFQKVLVENDALYDKLDLILLHECGGITRYEVYRDKILINEPESWRKVDDVTHDYCYGCSDYKSSSEV